MSEGVKVIRPDPPEQPRKLLVVASAICKLCTRPILPRDLGNYLGEPCHRLCAAEQKLEDAWEEINRLHVAVDAIQRTFGPIPREAM